MTNQEVFDTVVNHLRQQGQQCVSDDDEIGCAYRGPNGMKCAVGALIPDELYDEAFEGKNVYQDEIGLVLRDLGIERGLAAELQNIHDRDQSRWEERWEALADERGLRYTPPGESRCVEALGLLPKEQVENVLELILLNA